MAAFSRACALWLCLCVLPALRKAAQVDPGPCCLPDVSVGLDWPTAPIGITVRRKCNNIHSILNPFTCARRTCLSGGVWGPVDVSGCTVLNSNAPAIAVTVVANVTASRQEVEANRSVLVDQITSTLSEYNPQGFALKRWYNPSEDTHTTAVISGQLPLSTDSSLLSVYADNGPPPGMFVFAGPPEIYGFTPSGMCQCGSRGVVNHTFQELCISPMVGSLSLSSCRCYTEQCSCQFPFTAVKAQNYTACTIKTLEPEVIQNCAAAIGTGGCPVDSTSYYILSHSWGTAAACTVVRQPCSASNPYLLAGMVQRVCNSDGQWEVPDVSECQEYMYSLEEIQAESLELQLSIAKSPVVLAGSRLDVIASDCNAYYVARLEHLTSSLPSSLSTAQQLLPKEASTVAQFLHSASQIAKCTNLFQHPNYTQEIVSVLQDFLISSRTNMESWNIWTSTLAGMEELSFLAEAIQLITSELSANLDSFADAILDASGVYRWSSIAQNELGIEAELVSGSFNGTRVFLESVLQLVDKVRVSFVSSGQNSTGVPVSVAYSQAVFSQRLTKMFLNQSSIGFADVHPVVVFVSARESDRFTADIHFKLESPSTYARGQCVWWVSATGGWPGGWSDSNVTTTQTVNGAICTSGQPGMYGLLQVIPLELQATPPSATVYPGNEVTLSCFPRLVPSHEGDFNVTWKHSGSPLNERLDRRQYQVLSTGVESNLTLFTSLELSTAGTYTCEAQGSPPSSVSTDVELTLHPVSMLNMTICNEGAVPATGGELCILCTAISATGNPVPTEVIWSINGSTLSSYPPGTFVYSSGAAVENMLVVVTPTPEFTGLYSCAVRESPAVLANKTITVHPGCASTAFAQASPVGAQHRLGCYTWSCVSDQHWVGDYSECVSELEPDMVHLSFLVTGNVSTVENKLTTITNDEEEAIRDGLGILHLLPASPAIVAASGTYNVTLVSYPLQVDGTAPTDTILSALQEELLFRTLNLGGLKAMLSPARSIAILDSDVCDCPLLIELHQTEDYQPIPRVHLCRQTEFSSVACNCTPGPSCSCTDEFTEVEHPADQVSQCSLDTDRDDVPDYQDPCLGCCAADLSSGFLWERTPEGIGARVSCGMLHPTLNDGSYITRTCSTDGVWSGVSIQSCTFSSSAASTLVVSVFHIGDEEEELRMVEEESKEFLSKESLTTPSQVTLLYHSLSDGVGSSTTSVTAVVELPSNTSQEAEHVQLILDNFSGIQSISRFQVVASPTVYSLKPATNCTCNGMTLLNDGSLLSIELCKGPSLPSCSCTSDQCQCSEPFDELSPGVVPVGSVVCSYSPAESSIIVPQSGCTPKPGAQDCVGEPANFPHLPWSSVPPCHSEENRCAEDPNNALGTATRFCNSNGIWETPDLTQCETAVFRDIRMTTEQILSAIQNDPMHLAGRRVMLQEELVTMLAEAARTLVSETAAGQDQEGLLPKDLNTTVIFLDAMASISEDSDLLNQPDFNTTTLFMTASNALEDAQRLAWRNLSQNANFSASATLLSSIERQSLAVAMNMNETGEHVLSFANIDVQAMQVNVSASKGLVIPVGISSPSVSLPQDLVTERREETDVQVPVAVTVMRRLSQYLPNRFTNQTSLPDAVYPSDVILSAQVGETQGLSPVLEQNPVNITFNLKMCQETAPSCVFYDFNSTSSKEGGWSMEGVSTSQTNATEVECASNHLTSFAILVSRQEVPIYNDALSIASYIGCVLSFICLSLSIIFFLSMRRDLVDKDSSKNYINFVHLNLCIALAIGLLIFMAGIQGGSGSMIGCTIVSALLHYFFLAAFCWMLCEAVVLYNLLIMVFPVYVSSRRWLILYSSIGWGLPLPVVVISLIAVLVQPNLTYYRQYSTPQDPTTCSISTYTACWLPVEGGVIAAFLIPVGIILVVNTVLLVIALRSLWHQLRRQHSVRVSGQSKHAANRRAGIKLAKAILILTPLMGFTWVIGVFAVDQNTAVFAWLFLLVNSLQGVFFFIFYVLRHDRMRPKLRKALTFFRKWCWQRCSVCHRVTDSELVPSPSTEEPRPLQQDNGEADVHTTERGVQSSIRRLTRRMLSFFHHDEHGQETDFTSGTSTLLHAPPTQLDSSTAGDTTFVSTAHEAAVQQDTQQSSTDQEPLTTDTLQLVPLPSSHVESSTEESNGPFRIIDIVWEEEV